MEVSTLKAPAHPYSLQHYSQCPPGI
jgi:hypothetical protein